MGSGRDPKNAWAHIILGWAYEQKSMIKEAVAEFEAAIGQWKDSSIPLAGLGHAYGRSGQEKAARENPREAPRDVEADLCSGLRHRRRPHGLGEIDQALEWLSKAYEERSGFSSISSAIEGSTGSVRIPVSRACSNGSACRSPPYRRNEPSASELIVSRDV